MPECEWCGEQFEQAASRKGPVPKFCSPAHRQADFRNRRGVGQGMPVVTWRYMLDELTHPDNGACHDGYVEARHAAEALEAAFKLHPEARLWHQAEVIRTGEQ